jgi:hypothetical protein
VSDPAPLPRLGEVFFDVRGNSRSMRLSWYADTGVAVFSIWQAGMCTGTFRLPMADLSRMIAILQRGPAPRGRGRAPVSPRQAEDRGSDSDWYYGPDGDEPARPGGPPPGGYGGEQAAEYGGSGRAADYGRSERGPADYGAGGYGHAGHGGGADTDFGAAGYEPAEGYGPADYGADGAGDTRYYGGGYGSVGEQSGDDYGDRGYQADYGPDEFAADGGYQRGYEQAGYGPGGHQGAESDYLTGEYPGYADQRRAGSDRGYAETDGSGYHDERFVAPYAGDDGQTYANDNPARGTGYPGDIGDAAYPADRRSVSRSDRYLEPSAPDEAYSYGAEYRYR